MTHDQLFLPAGERNPLGILLIRVHHAVQLCNITLRVSDDWIGEPSGEVVVGNDVLDPPVVGLHLITRQGDKLDTPLSKLVAECLHPAKLGGADRGVVSRMREEDGPAVLDPAVEVYVALSGVSTEVRDNISQLENVAWHPI